MCVLIDKKLKLELRQLSFKFRRRIISKIRLQLRISIIIFVFKPIWGYHWDL